MRNTLFYARKFLNPPGQGGSAHIIARVHAPQKRKSSAYVVAPGYELRIADCYRAINLEFSSGDFDESKKKLDLLIDTLSTFRERMNEAQELYQKLLHDNPEPPRRKHRPFRELLP